MRFNKLFFMSLVISGAMWFGLGGTARAQSSCSNRVRQDQRELDQAINRYGYYSQQAAHERAELQRDAANCRYDDYGARNYNDGDRNDWQYRNNGDRNDRYYNDRNYTSRYDRSSPAFDNGYRDGVAMGQRDSQKRKSFNPQKNDQYEDADHGYNRSYGDKNQYKSEYRQGFQSGYADGYRRG